MYSLYLYFLGVSLRNTSKALDLFDDEKRVIKLYGIGYKDFWCSADIQKKKSISAFIIDETIIDWKSTLNEQECIEIKSKRI